MSAEVVSKKSACELHPMNSFFISLVRTWAYGFPDHWESGKLDAYTLDKFKVQLLRKIVKNEWILGWAISSVCLKSIMDVKWSEVAQSCPNLCNPMDCRLPGSSAHGIFQTRVLEWVAISFSRVSSQPRDWTQVSRVAGRRFTIWATKEVNYGEGGISAVDERKTENLSEWWKSPKEIWKHEWRACMRLAVYTN